MLLPWFLYGEYCLKITRKVNSELESVITIIWMSHKAEIMSNVKKCINEST